MVTAGHLESPFDVSTGTVENEAYETNGLYSEYDVAVLDELVYDFVPDEELYDDDADLRAPETEVGVLEKWAEFEGPGGTVGPTLDDFVAIALTQRGDRYVFGAEADINDPNPSAFDCSELVEWASARAGVRFVDGAQNQRNACRDAGTLISVEEGLRTRGALLFRIDEGPGGDHVAISLGDGSTMEAKGSSYGVNVFSAANRRWTHAGIIPGFRQSGSGGSVPTPVPVPIGTRTLRRGSRGEDVRSLQRTLQMHGFDTGPADGIFGSRTESAVRAFQQAYRLKVDGVVGPQTHGALARKRGGSGGASDGTAPPSTHLRKVRKGYAGYGGPKISESIRRLTARGLLTGVAARDIDTLQRVADVESRGLSAAINTWDNAVVSAGFKQWTLKWGELQDLIKRASGAFAKHGISLDPANTYRIGDAEPVPAIAGVRDPRELRSAEWSTRFFTASLEDEAIAAAVTKALEDIGKLERKIRSRHGWAPPFDTPRGRALLVQLDNNRPAYIKVVVPRVLQRASGADTESFLRVMVDEIIKVYASRERDAEKGRRWTTKVMR